MKRREGNIAATNAMLRTGSAAPAMSAEQFRREKLYQATMHIVREMRETHLITEEEYHAIDTIFAEKYRPIFGGLFSE